MVTRPHNVATDDKGQLARKINEVRLEPVPMGIKLLLTIAKQKDARVCCNPGFDDLSDSDIADRLWLHGSAPPLDLPELDHPR